MCQYCAVDGSCNHEPDPSGSDRCACSFSGPARCAKCDHDCVLWFSSLEIPGHATLTTLIAESADSLRYPALRDEIVGYARKSDADSPEEIRWLEQQLPVGSYRDPGAVIAALAPQIDSGLSGAWVHPISTHALATGTRIVVGPDERAILIDSRGGPCDTFASGTVALSSKTAPRAAARSRPVAPGFDQTALEVAPVFFSTQDIAVDVSTSVPTRPPGYARISVQARVKVELPERLLPLLPRPIPTLSAADAGQLLNSRAAEWVRKAASARDLAELRASPSLIEAAMRSGASELGLGVSSVTVNSVEPATPSDLAAERMQRMASIPNLPPEVAAQIQARMAAARPAPGARPAASAPPGQVGGSSASVILCAKCHAPNPPTGKFCGNCGSPLNVRKVCVQCHSEIAPGVKFCGNCGAPAT